MLVMYATLRIGYTKRVGQTAPAYLRVRSGSSVGCGIKSNLREILNLVTSERIINEASVYKFNQLSSEFMVKRLFIGVQ